jgi:hypothetical protein
VNGHGGGNRHGMRRQDAITVAAALAVAEPGSAAAMVRTSQPPATALQRIALIT